MKRKLIFLSIMVLLLWAALCLPGACDRGRSFPPQSVLLADYAFGQNREEPAFGLSGGDDGGLHWFAEGWYRPLPEGLWMTAKEASVHLFLLKKDCAVRIECAMPARLSFNRQVVTASMKGRELGKITLTRKSRVAVLSFTIPADMIRQGMNTLALETEKLGWLDLGEHREKSSVTLLLKTFNVRARLDNDKEWIHWQSLTGNSTVGAGCDTTEQGVDEQARERFHRNRSGSGAEKPDVFLILLDAARPDHLGCYGYPRNTSPEIDRLAGEGVVLENAFSTAAFTSAAVPSLLTGRIWRDYRAYIQHEDPASAAITTFAETMKAAGYKAMGFTANGNVSRANNSHLGFDEWVETWTQPDKTQLKPNVLEHLFRRRLEQSLGTEPAFVFLHMLPPHQPYSPGLEHDLWSDPEYPGWITGSSQDLVDLNEKNRTFGDADVRRLIALYDGNLHRGDASMGRMLEAWKSLKRGRELVVVILSDHGEAFGEHDFFGHTNTVYDEMTRIPLIFHPERLCKELTGCESLLVSIADVMPMLLHVLGIAPIAGRSYQKRFLAILENPAIERRIVFFRTGVWNNTWGVRMFRHLAMSDGWSEQALFQLHDDPKAQRNLRLQAWFRYNSMIGWMRTCLEQMPPYSPLPEGPRITPEDIEYLKEIGY